GRRNSNHSPGETQGEAKPGLTLIEAPVDVGRFDVDQPGGIFGPADCDHQFHAQPSGITMNTVEELFIPDTELHPGQVPSGSSICGSGRGWRSAPFHMRWSMSPRDRRWIVGGPRACRAALWVGQGYPLLASKLYAGYWSATPFMIRSRVTLARIEAVAIDREVWSPRTILRAPPTKSQFPSTRTWSGFKPNATRARRAANRWASDIPSSSHSSWLACPTAQAWHQSATLSKRASRSLSVSIFESRIL